MCILQTRRQCKWGPYRTEDPEMHKWNTPTDRAKRVDEKNGVICLVIVFTPRFMVNKVSKMAHFLYFLYFQGLISC